jgi:hypothetical protein
VRGIWKVLVVELAAVSSTKLLHVEDQLNGFITRRCALAVRFEWIPIPSGSGFLHPTKTIEIGEDVVDISP